MQPATTKPRRFRSRPAARALAALLILGASVLLATGPGLAKRTNAPKVMPVERNGIRYVAPNHDGRHEIVEAWDIRSGRKLWTATLFRNKIDPAMEEDVQWVFIKRLDITDGKLVAIDERGRKHVLDLTRHNRKLNGVHLREPLTGTPFLLPGQKLAIGWTEIGLPISAFEKLYLEDAGGPGRVTGPKDLVGHVRVDTASKALRYVRLFTSPATVRAFDLPVWLEVVPASKVDADLVYGRTSDLYIRPYVEDLRRLANMKESVHQFGVVPDEQWKASGLQSPRVERTREGFVVTRGLILIVEKSPWGTGIVQQVAETVSSDGRVTRRLLSKRKMPRLLVTLMPEE